MKLPYILAAGLAGCGSPQNEMQTSKPLFYAVIEPIDSTKTAAECQELKEKIFYQVDNHTCSEEQLKMDHEYYFECRYHGRDYRLIHNMVRSNVQFCLEQSTDKNLQCWQDLTEFAKISYADFPDNCDSYGNLRSNWVMIGKICKGVKSSIEKDLQMVAIWGTVDKILLEKWDKCRAYFNTHD